ncbi:hypothetical protein ACWCPM_30155 [Streptomyces sp. NPDC002309]
MTSGNRQRRDGTSKRAQLTSGDHRGPKDKRGKPARVVQPDGGHKKAAAKRAWSDLFARIEEAKKREAQRKQRGGE